jgi:aerobic-type carbon monoxide dehydrogenase small subunit (CoxS/CutS family)
MQHRVQLTVNGEACEVLVEPHKTLLSVLRDGLGLSGSKEGCGEGECAARTVVGPSIVGMTTSEINRSILSSRAIISSAASPFSAVSTV